MKKFIQCFFASIFSIFFFVILLILSVLLFSKNLLSQKSINSIIKNVDIVSVDLGTILGDEYKNKSISSLLTENFKDENINIAVAEDLLRSDVFKDKLSTIISNYVNYTIYGAEKKLITINDFKEVLPNEKLEEIANVKLTGENTKEIDEFFTSTVNKLNSLYDEIDENISDLTGVRNYLNIIYSQKTLIIIISTLLALFLLIALSRWSFLKAFMWISIPTMLISLIYIIPFVIKTVIYSLFKESFSGIGVFINIFNIIFKSLLYQGLITLSIGIVLMLIFIFTLKKDYDDLKLDNL